MIVSSSSALGNWRRVREGNVYHHHHHLMPDRDMSAEDAIEQFPVLGGFAMMGALGDAACHECALEATEQLKGTR